ncbi:hypothetical protein LR48_Vigan303s000100 [Vigna angularis]|uniref:Uncharacterized protein n=1 Tax=Phaseolus angularis TaxID=3914 RepID=A0A0L9T905_PHAAN|nr:hypothetical protein LR48_Vigan303s000100 [Vigna angularis]
MISNERLKEEESLTGCGAEPKYRNARHKHTDNHPMDDREYFAKSTSGRSPSEQKRTLVHKEEVDVRPVSWTLVLQLEVDARPK